MFSSQFQLLYVTWIQFVAKIIRKLEVVPFKLPDKHGRLEHLGSSALASRKSWGSASQDWHEYDMI